MERWVQSIQQECLNHFLMFGPQHFDYVISEYVDYYHKERPHQSLVGHPCVMALGFTPSDQSSCLAQSATFIELFGPSGGESYAQGVSADGSVIFGQAETATDRNGDRP